MENLLHDIAGCNSSLALCCMCQMMASFHTQSLYPKDLLDEGRNIWYLCVLEINVEEDFSHCCKTHRVRCVSSVMQNLFGWVFGVFFHINWKSAAILLSFLCIRNPCRTSKPPIHCHCNCQLWILWSVIKHQADTFTLMHEKWPTSGRETWVGIQLCNAGCEGEHTL